MITRRQFAFTGAAAIAATTLPTLEAQAFVASKPFAKKSITLVVSMPKNGPTDHFTRFIAAPLSKALGADVTVSNITGDWGMTGAMTSASAAADGRTLILGTFATHAALPTLTGKYDAVNDFTPISLLGISPMVLLAPRNSPFNNLRTLHAYAQTSGKHLRIANGGLGSASAITARKLKQALGAPLLQDIVYSGTAPALDDLAQGRADLLCDQMISALPMIRTGKVKALGLAASSRNLMLPDVLTGAQQGFADFRSSNWNALFAPKGMDVNLQAELAAAVNSMFDDVTLVRKMAEHGLFTPFAEQRGPVALANLQRQEIADLTSAAVA